MKESAILRSITDRREALATARAVAKRNGLRLVLEREAGLPVLSFADFIEPECLGPAWDGGSGEGGWLYRFLAKWIAENAFSLRRLEGLLRWKLARDFRAMT
jgi:hypothetical protein